MLTTKEIAKKELLELYEILFLDCKEAQDNAIAARSHYAYRVYLRAFFCLVEGFLYRLRQIAIKEYEEQKTFKSQSHLDLIISQKDFEKLKEEKTGFLKIKGGASLIFSLEAYALIHGATFTLEKDKGWKEFIHMIDVRHQITHPKNASELEISDENLKTLTIAYDWWYRNIAHFLLAVDYD